MDFSGRDSAPVGDEMNLMQAVKIGTGCLLAYEAGEAQRTKIGRLDIGNAAILDHEAFEFGQETGLPHLQCRAEPLVTCQG